MNDSPDSQSPTPGIPAIFWNFLVMGLSGFGGVLPIAHRTLVDRRKWLSETEFAEMLSLCQLLPGGNIMNLSVAVGMRFAGAAAGLLGLVAVPSAVMIAMGAAYAHYSGDAHVRHMFVGMAAATGLLAATTARLAWRLRGDGPAIGVACLCFGAIAVLRLPLVPVIAILAPASLLLMMAARRPV